MRNSIQSRTQEEILASEASVTKFKIKIQDDTAALLERIVEEFSDLVTSFFEAIAEVYQCLHFLVLEDCTTISIAILVANWIVCNALSPFIEMFLEPIRETKIESSVPAKLCVRLIGILNFAFADLDKFATHYHGGNTTSIATRDKLSDNGEGDINSPFSPFVDIILVGLKVLDYIPPTAMTIAGPLMLITLTCIVADNKYYLFATLFAPMVDHTLSSIKSFIDIILPSHRGYQQRTIPDDEEPRDGVLWGMIMLFCLESFLIGSIIVLMVLISFFLSILTSIPTILSPRENPELIEEISKILVFFVFLWVACVVSMNVLRMVLYQTIESDD